MFQYKNTHSKQYKWFYGNHCAEPVSLCKVKVVSSNAKTTLRLTENYQRQPSIFLLKNGIPMIIFCDVLAYTTYNHTYFLRRKKAIRRRDVPMKH